MDTGDCMVPIHVRSMDVFEHLETSVSPGERWRTVVIFFGKLTRFSADQYEWRIGWRTTAD